MGGSKQQEGRILKALWLSFSFVILFISYDYFISFPHTAVLLRALNRFGWNKRKDQSAEQGIISSKNL